MLILIVIVVIIIRFLVGLGSAMVPLFLHKFRTVIASVIN